MAYKNEELTQSSRDLVTKGKALKRNACSKVKTGQNNHKWLLQTQIKADPKAKLCKW